MAESVKRREVCEYGKIANTPAALHGLVSHSATGLRFCYEAGPCGYGMQRQLTTAGHDRALTDPAQARRAD